MADPKGPPSSAGKPVLPASTPGRSLDPDSTLPLGLEADGLSGLFLRSILLRVIEGPQQGAEFCIEGDVIRLGSAAGNDVVLEDATVSRRHAEICMVGHGLTVRDLGSRNGSFLDGNRVKEAFLYPGCRVRLGGTTLTVQSHAQDLVIAPSAADRFGDLHGATPPMRHLFGMLARIAPTEVTVVLSGETGTGKEVAARALHQASQRAKGPFAVLDCSAVDRDLISAELFGHEVGAFTGATVARAGAFEQAHGGTLFIDEIGELPLDLQAKLLRALEQREVKRLGGAKPVRFDCRVVAATHRHLRKMVEDGTFREDLYYRLAQVVVKLPPLRERREDIPLLVERFLARGRGAPKRPSPAALERLGAMEWRGNLRELRNVVERARALAVGPEIGVEHIEAGASPLDGEVAGAPAQAPSPAPQGPTSLADAEREVIESALKACGYHRARAAQKLAISLPTLRERIRRYGIPVPKRARPDDE